jgi:hypothetical protein
MTRDGGPEESWGRFGIPQSFPSPVIRGMMVAVPDKPTYEQIRREAETLRQTAIKLMEHAAVLIEKSAQLEQQISLLKRGNSKQGRKP